ncbi:4-hydroxythreonine-4-phosphate dehydrogenase PdxA [Microbaculum sp. FT89]|uniref:4-hydroxythreonine-4-phosphate dehydrogenase PdxA n=1 Tax=Microbaculum sp. FT89 TaxID=3447298 RepID=UPI003F53A644
MSRDPLVVTMGEPAGVGPELIGLSWLALRAGPPCPFYCLADPDFLSSRLKSAGVPVPVITVECPDEVDAAFGEGIPVMRLESRVRAGTPGNPSTEDAPAVLEAIERAVTDVIDGRACGVVTAPVQKETLYDAGFAFPGHTEFLGDLARRRGLDAYPVMMIASDELRVVPVTVHVPIADVSRLLTEDLIVETSRIVARELTAKFGIAAPRLAVAGLNPHAGEGGRIGTEDRDVVAPAVAALVAEGIGAHGPQAADTLFHASARRSYDAAICMYHDQALIPIKTIAFDDAVNVTLGLPFVRTSPDHGTALSLAGTGKANPSSFVAAIRMAWRMSARP